MSSVDVIVPCYAYGCYLRTCVESVLTQSHTELRVLILDDCSPDNTAEVAAELAQADSRVSVIRHDVNKGHIATYNEGIDWSSSDYQLLLSADDYLLPGALARAAEFLDTNPNVGFVFGRAIDLYPDGNEVQTKPIGNAEASVLTGAEFITLSWPINIVPTPTAVVRTELLKRLGGYRAELPHAADMELWLRLSAHADVGALHAPQAVYRKHGANMSVGYYGERLLLDFRQRALVLDAFLADCGHLLDHVERRRENMRRALSDDAAVAAGRAFTDGHVEAAGELARFAVELCPAVTRSLAWKKYAFKRWLGQENWQAIRKLLGARALTPGRAPNDVT